MNTGNATAPPPSLVAPATSDPNAIVNAISQFAATWPIAVSGPISDSHSNQTVSAIATLIRNWERTSLSIVASLHEIRADKTGLRQ